MAIAYDNVLADTARNASSSTRAFTITGSNTAIVVGIQHTSTRTVSSVTYAGTNLTQIHANIAGEGGGRCDLWLLVGTSTGSNNVVVTMSGTDDFRESAVSYTGVGTGSGTGGSDTSAYVSNPSSTGTSATISYTTTVANTWGVAYSRSQNQATASTNLTYRNSVSGVVTIGDSAGSGFAAAGSHSQVYNPITTNNIGAFLGVVIVPSGASSSIVPSMATLGVGA